MVKTLVKKKGNGGTAAGGDGPCCAFLTDTTDCADEDEHCCIERMGFREADSWGSLPRLLMVLVTVRAMWRSVESFDVGGVLLFGLIGGSTVCAVRAR